MTGSSLLGPLPVSGVTYALNPKTDGFSGTHAFIGVLVIFPVTLRVRTFPATSTAGTPNMMTPWSPAGTGTATVLVSVIDTDAETCGMIPTVPAAIPMAEGSALIFPASWAPTLTVPETVSVSFVVFGVLLSIDSPNVGIGSIALLLMTRVALYQTQGTQTPNSHGGGVKLLGGGAGVLDDAGAASDSPDPDGGTAAGVGGAAGACGAPVWAGELGGGASVTVFVTVGAGAGFAGVLAACGLLVAASGTAALVDEGVAHPAAKSAAAATVVIAIALPPRKLVICVPFPIPIPDTDRFLATRLGPAMRRFQRIRLGTSPRKKA